LKPFREKEENYFQFAHEVDLITTTCINFSAIFENPIVYMKIQRISQDIYLSNPIHIKKREVYVTYLTNVNIDNVVDAIGVLKVSCKLIFYNLKKKGTLRNDSTTGINLSKLDKGCLIFNHKKEEGYNITVDSNRRCC
jgi:hypothetical protein